MNIFDNNINVDDEEFILQVKSLDNKGLQKFVNLIDSVRALQYISRTNWYFGKIETQNDLICEFQNTIKSIQQLTNLEFYEITSQHISKVIEQVSKYRKILESEIEKAPNANNTTFTSSVEFARTTLPVIIAIYDSLEAMYDESLYNILASLNLEAHQLLSQDKVETLDYKDGLDKIESNAEFKEVKNYLDNEETHFFRLLELFAKNYRMMETSPHTAKALFGKNLLEVLEATSKFYVSRGQTLSKVLKNSK